jgi:plastocyanin
MGRGLVAAVMLVFLGFPGVAAADKKIEAAPPYRFTTTSVTMDQGERLTFHNGDTVTHDVTATEKGPDGKPLFASASTDAGKETFVEGSQYLTSGHYDFICSLHPNMKGTLHVTGNGTPQQRPGAAPSNAAPSAVDRTAPTFGLRVLSRRLSLVRADGALRVRVTVSETAHVVLRAVARPRAGGPLVTVASAVAHLSKGAHRVSLVLTRAGRAALRGKRRFLAVVVTGSATDDAGNKATRTHGRTLRV